MTFGRAGGVVLLVGALALGACREQGRASSSGGGATTGTGTTSTPTTAAAPDARSAATSGPASGDAGGAARNGATSASTDAGAASASAAGSGVFEGSATGASADPPIREFAPRVVVPAWSEQHGTVHLEVPEGDGAVTGTMVLGELRFNARGRRVGPHVRASLEQPRPEGAGDGGTGVPLYYGTLDGDLTGAGLRGTWEAGAQGGYLRRRGTFEAQRH